MVDFRCDEIVRVVKGNLVQAGRAQVITGVGIDHRKIKAGDLFIPIVGERLDGHAFIPGAVENGAAAVLTMGSMPVLPESVTVIRVQDTTKALQAIGAAYRQKFDLPVVAVTGSSGKTTTKDMIASVLSQKFKVMKTQGNLNNPLGVPQTLLTLEPDHEAAVIETGTNFPGDIGQTIGGIRPHFGVISNIGTAHLEFFKTQEGILKEKMTIFSLMGPDDVAIVNGDDPYLDRIGEVPYQILRVGITSGEDHLDFKAKEIVSNAEGVSFALGEERYACRFPGEHTVRNCLAAIAIGKKMGLTREEIQQGLDAFVPSGNRMKKTVLNGVVYIDDSYNANPDSMKAALNALTDLGSDAVRRIAVLGDMLEIGSDAPDHHRAVGQYAAQRVDFLIAVGQQARNLLDGAKEALSPDCVLACANAEAAAAALKRLVQPGDMVLIKGSNGVGLKKIMSELKGSEKV